MRRAANRPVQKTAFFNVAVRSRTRIRSTVSYLLLIPVPVETISCVSHYLSPLPPQDSKQMNESVPGRQTELNVTLVSSNTYKQGTQLVIHPNNGVLD
jgi:hypothetical protein